MREIVPGVLWIGHEGDLADVGQVLAAGIEAIVVVAPIVLPAVWPRDHLVLRVPLSDDESNSSWLLLFARDCVNRLMDASVPTLIACSAGMSRSVAIAATAISLRTNRPPQLVLTEITAHHAVDVSHGLWNSLQSLA